LKEGGEGNGTGEGDAVGGEGGGASSSALCPWQQTRIHCQKHPEIKSGEVSVARRAFGTPSNESAAFFRAPPQTTVLPRRKASHICAPQARKISSAHQNRCSYGAILGGAGASTPALAEQYLRVQLEQRAAS